ncbi:MAG: hypothetical protein IPN08_01580 [Bacteroidales bacterium]|nr:hypothetical protein [Bacteroidales bacterium]
MKTLKSLIIIVLVAFVTIAQAQKVIKVTDVVDGKTILQHAQKIDVDAFLQTKTIYKAGMTEMEFVAELQKNFPPEAASFKHLYTPYLKYVFSFHKNGLTENQVRGKITGVEFTRLCNDLGTWNNNNPGIIQKANKFPWKKILDFASQVIIIIITIFL